MTNDWNPWEMIDPFGWYRAENWTTWQQQATALGTDAWEMTILESIWYATAEVPGIDRLQERSFGNHAKEYPHESMAAVERCFAKGWIHVMTAACLSRVRDDLNQGGYHIVGGLVQMGLSDAESVGMITLTTEGRNFYLRWKGSNDDSDSEYFASEHLGNHVFDVYGGSIAACHDCLRTLFAEYQILRDAVRVGRWSSGLHRRFESGFSLRFRCDAYGDSDPEDSPTVI